MQTNHLWEGDYVETLENLIFSVKGFFHPEGRTVAYLRYIPDLNGERKRKDGMRFKRIYDLRDSTNFLRKRFPKYLYPDQKSNMILQAVPNVMILKTYRAAEGLKIDGTEGELAGITLRIVEAVCKEADVPRDSVGVSGSLLLGLAGPSSDVDLIVYGSEHCRRVYEALKRLRVRGDLILPYDERTVLRVVKERWEETGLDLSKFVSREIDKILHGVVDGREYFIRLVKYLEEVPDRDFRFESLGGAVIRAQVVEDSDSIYTPCSYSIENCSYLTSSTKEPAKELASFRGKFTEQARKGEVVEARGKLERVFGENEEHVRLLLGGPKDYLTVRG